MKQTPDVNVLVAAYRLDHAHHDAARDWLGRQLDTSAAGRGSTLLLPMVCASFVRLVTHPRIFKVPAESREAFEFLAALLAQPGCDMQPLGTEWDVFSSLCRGKGLAANLVQDAWIAAAARAFGATLVTFDRDFESLLDAHEFVLLPPSGAGARPAA